MKGGKWSGGVTQVLRSKEGGRKTRGAGPEKPAEHSRGSLHASGRGVILLAGVMVCDKSVTGSISTPPSRMTFTWECSPVRKRPGAPCLCRTCCEDVSIPPFSGEVYLISMVRLTFTCVSCGTKGGANPVLHYGCFAASAAKCQPESHYT